MGVISTKVSESGRMSIPAKLRKAVGLEHGGDVVVELDDSDIRIRTVDQAISRAQALTRRLLGNKPGASVDAFLAERRRESEHE